ncbi:hypothetical protein FCV25MIE_17986 [Fagus crenata]
MPSTTVVQVGITTTNPTTPAPITSPSSLSDLMNMVAPPSTPPFRSFSTPNHIRSGSPQSFRIHNSIDHSRLIQRSNGSGTFFAVVSIPLHTQPHPQWVPSKLPHPQRHLLRRRFDPSPHPTTSAVGPLKASASTTASITAV